MIDGSYINKDCIPGAAVKPKKEVIKTNLNDIYVADHRDEYDYVAHDGAANFVRGTIVRIESALVRLGGKTIARRLVRVQFTNRSATMDSMDLEVVEPITEPVTETQDNKEQA